MKTWWPTTPMPGNLGDILTPWMMRRDGVEPEFVGTDFRGKVLGIGSTLRFAQRYDEVWSTGLMRRSDRPDPSANFRALRGPISAEVCGVLGRVPLGDGAMCLPRYYAGDRRQGTGDRAKLAVVPHYIDLPHRDEWPADWKEEGVLVINPRTVDVEGFVNQILSAERVESSSLHGCIVAEAYGVPWKWVRIADRLNGDDTKFEDFRLSLPHVCVDDLMAARPWRPEF
jgi:hypothetical protein